MQLANGAAMFTKPKPGGGARVTESSQVARWNLHLLPSPPGNHFLLQPLWDWVRGEQPRTRTRPPDLEDLWRRLQTGQKGKVQPLKSERTLLLQKKKEVSKLWATKSNRRLPIATWDLWTQSSKNRIEHEVKIVKVGEGKENKKHGKRAKQAWLYNLHSF